MRPLPGNADVCVAADQAGQGPLQPVRPRVCPVRRVQGMDTSGLKGAGKRDALILALLSTEATGGSQKARCRGRRERRRWRHQRYVHSHCVPDKGTVCIQIRVGRYGSQAICWCVTLHVMFFFQGTTTAMRNTSRFSSSTPSTQRPKEHALRARRGTAPGGIRPTTSASCALTATADTLSAVQSHTTSRGAAPYTSFFCSHYVAARGRAFAKCNISSSLSIAMVEALECHDLVEMLRLTSDARRHPGDQYTHS